MATTVNASIRHKRGTEASMPTLKDGQIYLCSDTHKVYKGTSTGENILICNISALNDLANDKQDTLVDSGWLSVDYEGNAISAYSGSALKYRQRDKMVEVNGEIKGLTNINGSTEVTIGTLPSGYRPPRIIKTTCRGVGLYTCQLSINTDGILKLCKYANNEGYATSMTGEEVIQISVSYMIM